MSSSSSSSVLIPKLKSGGDYANWKPTFVTFCYRIGAAAVLTTEIVEYKELVAKREEWIKSEQQTYFSRALASSSSSSSSKKAKDADAEEEALTKAYIRRMLEQSEKVYGALVEALPIDIRPQVESDELPTGYAYAVWKWLADKYQNTEVANVAELLSQWMNLKQEAEESFDAYRARVNKLRSLLEVANEKPSDGVYAYILLDRLQPSYSHAVLALKAGDKLKDASKINWVEVIVFINNHERSVLRSETSGEEGGSNAEIGYAATQKKWQKHIPYNIEYRGTIAPPGLGQPSVPPPTTKPDDRGCFNCGSKEHISRYCDKKKNQEAANSAFEFEELLDDTNHWSF